MKVALNPARASNACKQAATLARFFGSRSRSQCSSYHSTATVGDRSTVRDGWSSLRDIDFGYRVFPIVNDNHHRAYTTSIMATTAVEDYDEYTLHNLPSETTQCDLGVLYPSDESDAGIVFMSDDVGSEYRFTAYDATLDDDEWHLHQETKIQWPGKEIQDEQHTVKSK